MKRRWEARLALLSGTAALVLLLVSAGLRGVALVAVGLAGLAVTAAGVWWVLAHSGVARVLALVLVLAAPAAVLVTYAVVGMLWEVLLATGLWAVAGTLGRSALAGTAEGVPERRVGAPRRPFLIMNPRSGGGKVGRFRLKEKAEALGAEVVVLDPAHPQDVAVLARRAIDRGADLVGVAGGDGTQALVAAVAADRDVPFLVICAGTRNHFALDLGLDLDDPSTCLEALTDGVEVRVDLGFIGERSFVNNASFGTYAAVVQRPEYRDDKVRTTLRSLPELLTRRTGPHLVVRAENVAVEAPQAVLVSNNLYRTGDWAGLGRRDRLDQGTLGVLSVRVDNAAQAAGLLRGRSGPGLISLSAREVVVDADAAQLDVGVDGEALTLPAPVRCRSAPGALRVVLPRHRRGKRSRAAMNWREVRRLALSSGRLPARDASGEPVPAEEGTGGARPAGAVPAVPSAAAYEPGSAPDAGDRPRAVGRRGLGRAHGRVHRRPWRRPPRDVSRIDYTGAVYGSLLAGSVVVGAGALGSYPRVQLAALLLCTGVVFWAAHVYAHLFGASLVNERLTGKEVRRVCADERPIIEAAVPPALAVLVGPLFGLGIQASMWLALAVAIADQVVWAAVGAVRAGATRRVVAISVVVNLLLGGFIVGAKAVLTH